MSIDYGTSLKALHLYGMATAWSELQAEQPKQTHRPESWMERLLAAEQTDRQLKSLRCQLLKLEELRELPTFGATSSRLRASRFIGICWA